MVLVLPHGNSSGTCKFAADYFDDLHLRQVRITSSTSSISRSALHLDKLYQAGNQRPKNQLQAVRLHQDRHRVLHPNKNTAKVYINMVFHRRRQKPRCRRDLRSPPPPTTRPAAAAEPLLPPPKNPLPPPLKTPPPP
jgi:hypothetical protein